MKIHKYENYEDYVEAQTEANVRKLQVVWVRPETIKSIHKLQPFASKILCHGTRNAREQTLFKQLYPTAEILGTEISHTATKFPMTIQHDFHEPLDGKWDIVYTNSFDHSYDPEKALTNWKSQIAPGGSLYLEHAFSEENNKARRSDPLQIDADELLQLIDKLGMKTSDNFITVKQVSRVYRITL